MTQYLLPTDDRFEATYRSLIWNAKLPDVRPAAIVHARDAAEVAAAVVWARERGLGVRARSGGHSFSVSTTRSDSVLIDVGALDRIEPGSSPDRVRVGPGRTGGSLVRELDAVRRFFPSGHCPDVGLGGYLLGGGFGWGTTHYGLACNRVVGVEVVTADGAIVFADDEHNADLLWAARGAGTEFPGIVTSYELETLPAPTARMSLVQVFPADMAEEVFRWAAEIAPALSTQVEFVVLGTTPVDAAPDHAAPVLTVAASVVGDRPDEARAALDLLAASPLASRALFSAVDHDASWDRLYEIGANTHPTGLRYSVDNMWTSGTPDEIVPIGVDLLRTLPTPESLVFWMAWPEPAVIDHAAYSTSGSTYIAAFSTWSDPEDDDRVTHWGRDAMRRHAALSSGIQFADENIAARPDSRYLSDESLRRLARIQADRDPDRVFRGLGIDRDLLLLP